MTVLLDIGQLSLRFRTERGPAHVLNGVDLTVTPGEIVGLVGESGSGKTTLARAILGMLPPHVTDIGGGHVRVDGHDMLWDQRAARAARGRAITFVPQDPYASFNPLFRVGTQVADLMRWTMPRTTRRLFGRTRASDEAAVLAMFEAVQLRRPREILAMYPHQLSGGQRQRVMIAMAMLRQPRLVIADEPTASLDATVQAQILILLRRMAKERGVAVLFTTHNLGAAWEICDRVAVMYAGQIVETAPRETFFSAPRHPYTRLLLASQPEPGRPPVGIPGEAMSALEPASGCPFAPRCARSSTVCRTVRPEPAESGPGHVVACHHPWTADLSLAHA